MTRVAFEMFGFREGQLQFLGQLLREVVTAQRDAALPHPESIRHHQVCRIRSHGEDDDRLGRIIGVKHIFVGTVSQDIVGDEVVDRDGSELHDVQLNVGCFKGAKCAMHLLPFHREQSHLGINRKAIDHLPARQLLEVPDNFLQRKRNLLLCFKAANVRQPLHVDRRRLEELRQAALSRHRNRDFVVTPRNLVAR